MEEALQRQLAERGGAEQALKAARDRVEALSADLRAGEEARLAAEQKQDPARAKIQDMQLKEQAAALAEQQFTEQLAEASADVSTLPDALKGWGSARTLPAEIERLTKAIADLGAVNLAALDELAQATERKEYLDRQAADLTEAMTTLESAIRQIDRESRELLRQTFDAVNTNFARLFPALFGGGQARLVLTGEEILDSGVQVIAQPPGKRNTSIHLLSGGEKALTAISLVFALFAAQPGAVLPAGRGRRAARRSQHRPILPDGVRDGPRDAVPVHLAQQDHDGDGQPVGRHHDARARRLARRRRGHRRGTDARGRTRCEASAIATLRAILLAYRLPACPRGRSMRTEYALA